MTENEALHADHRCSLKSAIFNHSLKHRHSSLILVHTYLFVPVNGHDSLRISHLRKPLLRHQPETQHASQDRDDKYTPRNKSMVNEPAHYLLVPSAQWLIERDTLKQRIGAKSRLSAIPPVIINRYDGQSHHIRSHKDNSHCHCLIEEQFARYSADKDKRNKHRTGREYGTEHRTGHFLGTIDYCILESFPSLPSRGNVVNQDNRVVCHHADTKKKSRQGDDVYRQSHHMEHCHREYKGDRHCQ